MKTEYNFMLKYKYNKAHPVVSTLSIYTTFSKHHPSGITVCGVRGDVYDWLLIRNQLYYPQLPSLESSSEEYFNFDTCFFTMKEAILHLAMQSYGSIQSIEEWQECKLCRKGVAESDSKFSHGCHKECGDKFVKEWSE